MLTSPVSYKTPNNLVTVLLGLYRSTIRVTFAKIRRLLSREETWDWRLVRLRFTCHSPSFVNVYRASRISPSTTRRKVGTQGVWFQDQYLFCLKKEVTRKSYMWCRISCWGVWEFHKRESTTTLSWQSLSRRRILTMYHSTHLHNTTVR